MYDDGSVGPTCPPLLAGPLSSDPASLLSSCQRSAPVYPTIRPVVSSALDCEAVVVRHAAFIPSVMQWPSRAPQWRRRLLCPAPSMSCPSYYGSSAVG